MLFHCPALTDGHQRLLDSIVSIRDRLKYTLSTPRRWHGQLRRTAFANAIRGSNSIEGYTVSNEDAVAAVDGEEPLDAERETWAAVTGYRSAMTYVLQLAKDPAFVFGEGYLRSLHFMMLSYDLSKRPGNWRPGAIFVRDEARDVTVYEGPDVDLVPGLIAELIDDLNARGNGTPAIVKAAMAHLNLVMIHPFSDGNGRMARCLQTLVLALEGILEPQFCSIEEFLGRNTQEYYDILGKTGGGKWSPGRDAAPWIDFCLNAHFTQGATILRRSRETERVWNEIERIVAGRGLPDRAIYALADAAFGYRVRNSGYRTIAEISENLASRDLKLLVDAGLLIATGERRGRVYEAAEELREIRRRNREPKILLEHVRSQS